MAIITDPGKLDAPAEYGLGRLEKALRDKGAVVQRVVRTNRNSARAASLPVDADFTVIAGVASRGPAVDALRKWRVAPPKAPEALVVHSGKISGRPAFVLCGADVRGLMYAALETAERVSWSTNPAQPFLHVRNAAEQPYIQERGVSIYTMQRAYFEQRLFNDAYWQRYFEMLAASRINRFVVIFGYENGGFMAPLYPYFFDVEEFPGVRLVGITPEQQRRHVEAFRRLIRSAHGHGIDFTVAIWDHIYRGGVQAGGIEGASELAGKPAPGLVSGLNAANLSPYTKAALRKFLDMFPDVDGLQFRMHSESGLKRDEMEGFWHDVFQMIRAVNPELAVDLRAKELPDSIIEDALRQGLRVRVATKYWMEQMGLPFHPTHINRQNQRDRRHSYADLLRYPQRYKVHWRLWNGGTTRLLLWGDPHYVRRFAESARLYGGDSFEVNEMLATKMLGEPQDAPPADILNPTYRYYDYEFERYWYFYQLWGRLSYDPQTPVEIWQREFARRFGPAGEDLRDALRYASRLLPRIVAASYPYNYFPTTRGWAEMMSMGPLRKYAAEHVTDTEQFQNARDRARMLLEGGETAAQTPEQSARFLEEMAGRVDDVVEKAEKAVPQARSNEFISTVTDVKILACLARYHAQWLRAAVEYSLFTQSGDVAALDEAIRLEKAGVAAWERLVEAAGDVYSNELPFGVHRVGFSRHWKEELAKLRAGLTDLERERAQAASLPKKPAARKVGDSSDREPPEVRLTPAASPVPGHALTVSAEVTDPSGVRAVRLRYRHVTQFEDYQTAQMTRVAGGDLYQATIPANFIVPEWDVMYFVEAIDAAGNGRIYPDIDLAAPYVVVPLKR